MSRPTSLALAPGVETVALTVPGAVLAALAARPAGHARGTAVLVPGFRGSKEDFLSLLPLLADRGWRAVTLDLRGQYESTHGPSGQDPYAVTSLAADVRAVADAVAPQGPVHLLGHSFGGLVARAAVLAAPDRFASLTLLCSGPAAIPDPEAAHLRLLLQVIDVMPLSDIHDAATAIDAQRGRPPVGGEVGAFLRRRFLANDPEHLKRLAQQLLDAPNDVDALRTALAAIPVLVAHGVGDDAWPPAQQRAMAERLGARYAQVEAAAHSPAVEAPVATAELLDDFWGSASAGSPSLG